VKNTGANFDSEDAGQGPKQQRWLPDLPTRKASAKGKVGGEDVGGKVPGSGSREDVPVEATASVDKDKTPEEKEMDISPIKIDASSLESSSPECSDDDGDFLDLLVDTLDGEFDPELLI
jgi:hypothetical protein